jgi:hypothetical protein
MMGRYILPWFGGGPAVWTACLLFFQIFLLAGYGYAHWLGSLANVRWQLRLHVTLLLSSLLLLPIAPRIDMWKEGATDDPLLRILMLLTVTVGGPYVLLSSTTPLLQRWFTFGENQKPPWRLYALSNLGSFLALLSYPFAIEPFLRLHTQGWIWSAGYMLFVAACVWTAWRVRSAPAATASTESAPAPAPGLMTLLFWLGISTCSSVVLVATTNEISEDIAVSPFLWVAALAVYLLTFVLAFESNRFYRRTAFAVAAGIAAPVACVLPSLSLSLSLWLQLPLYLIAQFIICMLCQGELARSRPAPRYLTTFYLTIAAGGALGGAFVALAAPRMFTEFSEYPIGMAGACLLGFVGWLRTGALSQWTRSNLSVRLPLMALLLGGLTAVIATTTGANQGAAASARNFYGILRVMDRFDDNGPFRELQHGRTRHGMEYIAGARLEWPTSYYGPHSGVALALNALQQPSRRIAVVGLGTGTLAAWGRSGDSIRFYEINPDVEPIARSWFSFLRDSQARTAVVPGDARVQLGRELADGRSHDFDLIAVDAFSGDSIPMHLLTAECADIYRQRLAPGGILALHISNRILSLDPVARGMALHLGWPAVQIVSQDDPATGESSSRWVLIASDPAWFTRAGLERRASAWSHQSPITWTDDFASLWHVWKF